MTTTGAAIAARVVVLADFRHGNMQGGPHHGVHRAGSRARLGVIPVIIAGLAAWLLLSGLHLGVFAWPGRLALFLVIFAAIRWLMRILWNLGRGGGFMGGGR